MAPHCGLPGRARAAASPGSAVWPPSVPPSLPQAPRSAAAPSLRFRPVPSEAPPVRSCAAGRSLARTHAPVPGGSCRVRAGLPPAAGPGMGAARSSAAPAEEPPRCLVDLNPLPDELLLLILSWVPGRTLVTRGRLVCARWRDLIDAPTLWRLQWAREPSKRGLLRAAQAVARRGARVEWSRLGVLQPLGRNLLRNPCGAEQLRHWEVQQGGDGWTVEENRHFVEGAEAQTCFVSSYQCCTKWQVVDLLKEGLWEDLLDTCQPDIIVSDWWGAREDCGCIYTVSVSLLSANRDVVLAEFSSQPDRIPQWNDAKYQQVTHVFQNYGPGVRYVRFQHKGQDTQFWAGHYGARITNSTVLVKIS